MNAGSTGAEGGAQCFIERSGTCLDESISQTVSKVQAARCTSSRPSTMSVWINQDSKQWRPSEHIQCHPDGVRRRRHCRMRVHARPTLVHFKWIQVDVLQGTGCAATALAVTPAPVSVPGPWVRTSWRDSCQGAEAGRGPLPLLPPWPHSPRLTRCRDPSQLQRLQRCLKSYALCGDRVPSSTTQPVSNR